MNLRQLLPPVLAVLALAGCGSSQAGNSAAKPAATGTAAAALVATAPATAAAATIAGTAAQPALPVTVADKDGRRVTITDVSRIVPLNGDITEVVFALGLGKNVAGVDTSATFPPEARSLPSIGYQRALSAEGILSLRPTVIIGNADAGPPPVIEQLRAAGVPVVLIASTTTIDGALTKIRTVAEALGVPGEGDRVAGVTRGQIAGARALAAKAASKPNVAFLYVRGSTTQMIGGRGSSADALILEAAARDAGINAGINGFQPITAEALVTAAPDVFLLLTAGLESVGGVDGLLAIPGIAQTPAGKNRRVVHFDDQYLLGLGPRVGLALTDLIKGLHPELQ